MKNLLLFAVITITFSKLRILQSCTTGQCQQPTCPNQYYFNGETCVYYGYGNTQQNANPNCPSGTVLSEGYCVNNVFVNTQQQ